MKVIHAGDIHLDPRAPTPALASLTCLLEYTKEHKPAAVLLAGDLFDRALPATSAHGMTELIRLLRELDNLVPVVSITGTPTHDRPGCYEPLRPYLFLLGPDKPWHYIPKAKLLVTGTPEPRIEAGDGERDHASAEHAALERTRQLLRDASRHRTAHWAKHDSPSQSITHVHLHHGAIAAAATDTGWYTTGAPGELSLLPQDLDLPMAQYVGCGHIHKQQRIEGCSTEAWYCGSAYPTDWGERDQKGCLLVTIPKGGGAHVGRLPYPHRPRRKYTITVPAGIELVSALGSAPELLRSTDAGCNIWLQVTHDPQVQPTTEDRDAIRALVDRAAGGDGEGMHRIDLRAAPREALVRADLSAVPDWADQLVAWLKATDGPKATESQLELARTLQAESAGPAGGTPHAWRINGIYLRGARGLVGGALNLDLAKFPPGLLAIAGPNGAGKTTVLEHMCPWPELLTRGGSLSAAFTGAGLREMSVTDTETGETLELTITIAQGGNRHHAITTRVMGADEDLLDDGTTRSYVAKVEQLFGDRSTYIAGAIQPQKPITLRLRGPDGSTSNCTSDLIAAPAGMRRHLLRSILGLEAYQHGTALARARVRETETALDKVMLRIETLPEADTEAEDLHQQAKQEATAAENKLTKRTSSLDHLRAELPAVQASAQATRELQLELTAVRREAETANTHGAAARQRALEYERAADQLPLLRRMTEDAAVLRTQLDEAQAKVNTEQKARDKQLQEIHNERERRQVDVDVAYDQAMTKWRGRRDAIEAARSKRYETERMDHQAALTAWQVRADKATAHADEMKRLQETIRDHQRVAREMNAEVERLTGVELPTCSVCGQPLGEAKRDELLESATRRRDHATARANESIEMLQSVTRNAPDPGPPPKLADVDVSDLDRATAENPEPQRGKPEPVKVPEALNLHAAEEARDQIQRNSQAHLDEWRRITAGDDDALARAQQADAHAKSAGEEAAREFARAKDANARAQVLALEIEPATLTAERDHLAAIAATQEEVNTLTRNQALAAANLKALAERLARELKRAEQHGMLERAAREFRTQVRDARLLQQALSPTGIQALLLEGAAPQIAADANRMLANSYGERWQIRLDLLKIGKDKVAEDLRIVVTDTESDMQPSDDHLGKGEQLAETLSGGEATWIRAALAGALALARARHTGQRQLTALLDEADGALSEEARVKYFDLLEEQHRMLGRHHTIVVTHSQEMLDRLGPERVIQLGGGE